MKKFFVAMGLVAFAFVGCDDSSSASAGPNDEPGVESSSSIELGSSSSEKARSQSSSSEKTGKSSSSVDDVSSSTVKSESSSSVEIPKSSSSGLSESSSSSADKEVSSSSSEIGCKTETEDNCEYGELIDDRDGQIYKTVKIGDQWWMAENLNYDPGQGGLGDNKYVWSWCYKDEPKNCDVAGRLYTWAAAMDSVKTGCGYGPTCDLASAGSATLVQGICPKGWHLPSKTEWKALFMAVGGKSTAGKVLKSQSGWYSNGNGTDAFGFSALPAGFRGNFGDFDYRGYDAEFWSSTEDDARLARYMYLFECNEDARLGNSDKYYGKSVRCVKD